ncbi:MAG: glycosyltransferase family 4 protein [Hyphomicrobiaceae bacterium]
MSAPLRILQCLRAPVGGLFRHVLDLAEAQAALGHEVGILADSRASDALTTARLEAIRPKLALGLHLIPMSRNPGIGDIAATQAVATIAKRLDLDVLHGHGAKGGLYARLAAARLRRSGRRLVCVYTPHGGVLHFDPKSMKGRVLLGAERAISSLTDAIVFESAFSQSAYRAKIGEPACETRVIPNGLKPDEFATVTPAPDAADLLFIGELRHLKGVDVLFEAIAAIPDPDRPRAVIVGAGPDAEAFKAQARDLGLDAHVTFPGAMPAREAFRLGRCLVVPSRAESFPYIVLEAAAAGLPMIATRVGGIPEIYAEASDRLVPAGDSAALRGQIDAYRSNPSAFAAAALSLRDSVERRFTVDRMSRAVLDLYRQRLDGADARQLGRTG